jgi:hypothetical protein
MTSATPPAGHRGTPSHRATIGRGVFRGPAERRDGLPRGRFTVKPCPVEHPDLIGANSTDKGGTQPTSPRSSGLQTR